MRVVRREGTCCCFPDLNLDCILYRYARMFAFGVLMLSAYVVSFIGVGTSYVYVLNSVGDTTPHSVTHVCNLCCVFGLQCKLCVL